MDESRPLKTGAAVRFLFRLCGRLLLLPLTLAACFSSEPPSLPKPSSDAFSQLAKNISELRQLPLNRSLVLDQAASAPPATAAVTAYYGGMPPGALESAYKSIGLLSNETDLSRALAAYRRLERLVSYDEGSGKVLLSPNLARLSIGLEKIHATTASETPAIAGIVAALQEQHFKWQSRIDAVSLEDRRLAFRAISAGDVVLTILLRAGAAKGDLAAANAQMANPIARELDKLGARLPGLFRQQLEFPYNDGSRFVLWAYKAKGWNGVNALYADPPLSTAQILHPEKYFIRRQLPLRFFPPALLRRFPEGPAVEQSFGEYLIGGLLATAHGAANASQLAATWRGDQLFSFQDGPTLATVWFSSWANENDAEKFLRAYRRVLEARQRLRFESPANGRRRTLIAAARDGRRWLLQAEGAAVIVVNAGSRESLTDLAEQAWKDLEIDAESTVIPFESAQRRTQLSFKSR